MVCLNIFNGFCFKKLIRVSDLLSCRMSWAFRCGFTTSCYWMRCRWTCSLTMLSTWHCTVMGFPARIQYPFLSMIRPRLEKSLIPSHTRRFFCEPHLLCKLICINNTDMKHALCYTKKYRQTDRHRCSWCRTSILPPQQMGQTRIRNRKSVLLTVSHCYLFVCN